MASHGTDQIIVQRLLAAKNQRDSRRALLTSGVIVSLPVHRVSSDWRIAVRVRTTLTTDRSR